MNTLGITVFHLGLIVFAAIQVHETKAAVVRRTSANAGKVRSTVSCDLRTVLMDV